MFEGELFCELFVSGDRHYPFVLFKCADSSDPVACAANFNSKLVFPTTINVFLLHVFLKNTQYKSTYN